MKWHEEVLDPGARRAASRLASCLHGRFYLAGGTALALRLGHRVSLDLDFFSSLDVLGEPARDGIIGALKPGGRFQVKESKDKTLHLMVGKTSVSLFHYPYPLLKPTSPWQGLAVGSIEDIAAMKLGAVVGRGSRKDFVDLYVLSRSLGMDRTLDCGVRKFREHADFTAQAARALVYFADAEKEPMPRLLRKLSWDTVKTYFEREVPRFLKKKLISS